MNTVNKWLLLGAVLCAPLPAFGQGSIVYVNPTDVFVGRLDNETFSFDLDGDGTMDVDFRKRSGEFQVIPRGNNEVSAVSAVYPEAGGYGVPIPFGAMSAHTGAMSVHTTTLSADTGAIWGDTGVAWADTGPKSADTDAVSGHAGAVSVDTHAICADTGPVSAKTSAIRAGLSTHE